MMSDHAKSCAVLGVLAGGVATFIVFAIEPAGSIPIGLLALRVLFPLVVLGSVGLAVWAHRRQDQVPDFLRRMFRKRFDCKGLSVALETEATDGHGYVNMYFQNRYERPCQARLTLSRMHGLAVTSKSLVCASAIVECPGAAFGCVRVPFGVPRKHQGRTRTFELTADVSYPSGRGRLLRYHPGRQVGAKNAPEGLAILALLLGGLAGAAAASSRAARIRLPYPVRVAESLPPGLMPQTEMLWLPGDAVNRQDQLGLAA